MLLLIVVLVIMKILESIDYSDLINWIAYNKYGVQLNKTQMQKLLFMCYGIYLASTGKRLFVDDTPKAWPFGPVFPRVNKKFIPGQFPQDFSKDKRELFLKDKVAMKIVSDIVEKFHGVSAHDLSEWSHQEGGPWFQVIYGKNGNNPSIKWNQQIQDDIIKEYFKKVQ